jgi:hypothetical protein
MGTRRQFVRQQHYRDSRAAFLGQIHPMRINGSVPEFRAERFGRRSGGRPPGAPALETTRPACREAGGAQRKNRERGPKQLPTLALLRYLAGGDFAQHSAALLTQQVFV